MRQACSRRTLSNGLDFEFHEKIRERAAQEAATKLGEQVAGTHARVGRLDAEIVRLAEEIGAGLIVAGSRWVGPMRRALLGSASVCPVLVVREPGDAHHPN